MYKRIIKSLSHHIDSALRLHFSRRNERVPAEVCPVVCFAGTPVAIAISVRLRLCPPKPSASRHPFTWPWAAMGSGGHSLQPSSFRFDCIDSPECALSSLRPRLAEATAVRALAIVATVATLSSPPPHLRHSLHHCHRHHHVVIATLAVSAVSAIVTLAIAIFANSPEKGLLPQRRVNL